ncbi:hypothetical protein BH10ACT2_BH10ACT2_23850 [soil metagenome]
MSVRSLTNLAVERDSRTPRAASRRSVVAKSKKSKKKKSDAAEEFAVLAPGDALVAAIPTEPLALYTGLVSGIVAFLPEVTEATHSYLPLRWSLFGGSAFFVVLWVIGGYVAAHRQAATRKPPRFPTAELAAALLAFGTWGLVMPESPLRVMLDGASEGITTLCVSVGGAAALYLFAQWGLTKAAKTTASK